MQEVREMTVFRTPWIDKSGLLRMRQGWREGLCTAQPLHLRTGCWLATAAWRVHCMHPGCMNGGLVDAGVCMHNVWEEGYKARLGCALGREEQDWKCVRLLFCQGGQHYKHTAVAGTWLFTCWLYAARHSAICKVVENCHVGLVGLLNRCICP